MDNDNNVRNEYSDYVSRSVADDMDTDIFKGTPFFQYEYIILIVAILVLIGSIALIIYLVATAKTYTAQDATYKPTRQAEELIIDMSGSSCSNETLETAVDTADSIAVNFEYSTQKVKLCDLEQTTNAQTKECALVETEEYIYIINVTGIPNNYYIAIEDDNTFIQSIYEGDSIVGGKVQHVSDTTGTLTTYTISVYYTDKEFKTCSDQLVKRFTITTPKYNDFYGSNICYGMEDYEYCLEFIYEDISNTKMYEKILEYQHEHNIISKEDAEFLKQFEEKKNVVKYIIIVYIVAEFVIVLIIIVSLYIRNAKRRKKEEEEA